MAMNNNAGVNSISEARHKTNVHNPLRPSANNITIRNFNMPERLEMKASSSSLFHASLKGLRLFRKVCRLMPFILRVHDLSSKVTPVQAKIYAANHFRLEAKQSNLAELDNKIQFGYETLLEVEWHYAPQGYLYRLLAPTDTHRDVGKDHINARFNKKEKSASSFLTSFYNGEKSHIS